MLHHRADLSRPGHEPCLINRQPGFRAQLDQQRGRVGRTDFRASGPPAGTVPDDQDGVNSEADSIRLRAASQCSRTVDLDTPSTSALSLHPIPRRRNETTASWRAVQTRSAIAQSSSDILTNYRSLRPSTTPWQCAHAARTSPSIAAS